MDVKQKAAWNFCFVRFASPAQAFICRMDLNGCSWGNRELQTGLSSRGIHSGVCVCVWVCVCCVRACVCVCVNVPSETAPDAPLSRIAHACLLAGFHVSPSHTFGGILWLTTEDKTEFTEPVIRELVSTLPNPPDDYFIVPYIPWGVVLNFSRFHINDPHQAGTSFRIDI